MTLIVQTKFINFLKIKVKQWRIGAARREEKKAALKKSNYIIIYFSNK